MTQSCLVIKWRCFRAKYDVWFFFKAYDWLTFLLLTGALTYCLFRTLNSAMQKLGWTMQHSKILSWPFQVWFRCCKKQIWFTHQVDWEEGLKITKFLLMTSHLDSHTTTDIKPDMIPCRDWRGGFFNIEDEWGWVWAKLTEAERGWVSPKYRKKRANLI